MQGSVEYLITQYDLEQGALEIQYIEEYFGEFPRKKTATEIVKRLEGRSHLILLATAPLPDDPGTVVPVSFKVAHEVKVPETEPNQRYRHAAVIGVNRHFFSDTSLPSPAPSVHTWLAHASNSDQLVSSFLSLSRAVLPRPANCNLSFLSRSPK
jgi:hypothetical protein